MRPRPRPLPPARPLRRRDCLAAVAGLAAWPLAAAAASGPRAKPTPAAPAPAVPVYPTRLPAAAVLEYTLSYGMVSGIGRMSWQPPLDGRYRLHLAGRAIGLQLLEWVSEGGVDAAGLAPWRFTERRIGRDPMVAEFRREAGRIHYPAKPSKDVALPAGAQDRLSWLVQLPAILRANPALQAPGQAVALFVSGARGDADRWVFEVQAPEDGLLHLRRRPTPGEEVSGEAWLAPAEDLLPLRVRLSKGPGETLEMRLRR
jgi:hypothetical protein